MIKANPRFVETVRRRGYRFIAPVILSSAVAHNNDSDPAQDPVLREPEPPIENPPSAFARREASALPSTISIKKRKGILVWAAIVAALLAAVLTAYRYPRHNAFLLTSKDMIVLADFENTTGEAVFDDALRQGLTVGLEQSPVAQILSDRKSAVILQQMGHLPDTRMTGPIAVELCQRAGGTVVVQGSISRLGATYLVGLAAVRCDNGEPIAHEQLEAKRREDVIGVLGEATTRLRARLGESLPSLLKYNAPLEQATTPSLDALNIYSRAIAAQNKDGDWAAFQLFNQALVLDPNFAMAYGELAAIYQNRGEVRLASDNAARAYALRERVTEIERYSIDFWYDAFVIGDLEKGAKVYELAMEKYPPTQRTLNDLGDVYGTLGQYQKSSDTLRASLRFDPAASTTFGNLAVALMALNRLEEADAVLADAEQRKLQTYYLLQVQYWRAFLRGDDGAMQRLILQSPKLAGAQSILIGERANSEAYSGHFQTARKSTIEAVDLMMQEGDKEAAATCWAEAAIREAEVGDVAHAREFISRAIKLAPSHDVVTLAALVRARTGDYKQAQFLTEKLDREYPSDTLIQKYWLPVVRAEVDLQQGNGLKAVKSLRVAEPLEFAAPSALTISTLYPAYVRGQAYLAAGDGERAATEFQILIDHHGMVLNFPLGALAYLGRARAYSLTANPLKAKDAYDEFFQLWKDSDPNIPILLQARAEFAHLNATSLLH